MPPSSKGVEATNAWSHQPHLRGPSLPFPPPSATLGASEQRARSHHCRGERDPRGQPRCALHKLIGKGITTSTPGRSLLTSNHTKAWDQAALRAQTHRLAREPPARQRRAARFPAASPEGGFPPQETGTALAKLPPTTGLRPSRNSTAGSLARTSPATRNSGTTSDTPQRAGGAGKAVEVEAGARHSVGMDDARRSIAPPGHARGTGKPLSECISMIHHFYFRKQESWRSGCCHKAGIESPTGDSQINVGNCYSGARTRAKQGRAGAGREMTPCRAPARFLLLNTH